MQEINNFLDVCIQAVKAGGLISKNNFLAQNTILRKQDNSIVTQIDIEAEKAMRKVIKKYFLDHKILGEELGGQLKKCEYTWVIDPIDGTSNYAKQKPIYTCGAALLKDNQILCSALLIPEEEKLFTAQNGKGAFLDNKKLSTNNEENLSKAVIATSRPGKFKKQFQEKIDKIESQIEKINVFGSGLYSIACVASGDINAAVCYIPKIWDVAPAILLAQESGATSLDYSGKPWNINEPELILANPKIAHQLADLIKNE